VSKSGWAKRYGRSVGHKAPGLFETRVATLARASGGSLEFVSTYSRRAPEVEKPPKTHNQTKGSNAFALGTLWL
jgi:hypothetical protein